MQEILSKYQKSKARENVTLSEKLMAITKAGATSREAAPICIICDEADVCAPCDANDWSCTFVDRCDLYYDTQIG
jgi:hypothetical protein